MASTGERRTTFLSVMHPAYLSCQFKRQSVMAIDKDGYIWIFSTAHGLSRPAYIHRSTKPYEIDKFERIHATRLDNGKETPLDNFSYFQIFYDPDNGFRAIFTRYNYPVDRTACFMSSKDGVHWSEWQRLAAIERGHYQIGAVTKGKLATMFMMHPKPVGLNARTNLYYMETLDNGRTWQTAGGKPLKLPLTDVQNPALIRDYQAEGKLVYIKDMKFDPSGLPVLLYSTSRGFEPGPENGDRMQTLARWTGSKWEVHEITKTDHNYDSASISFDDDGTWRVIAATESGPQPYGTGGEMVVWLSTRSRRHVAKGKAADGRQRAEPKLRPPSRECPPRFLRPVGRRQRPQAVRVAHLLLRRERERFSTADQDESPHGAAYAGDS